MLRSMEEYREKNKKKREARARQADEEQLAEAQRMEEEARHLLALTEMQDIVERVNGRENPTTELRNHDITSCPCLSLIHI